MPHHAAPARVRLPGSPDIAASACGSSDIWLTPTASAAKGAPSSHRTRAKGLGSLAEQVEPIYPTPVASTFASNMGGAAGRVGPVRLSLIGMARTGQWPTPTASDGTKGSGESSSRQGGPSLTTAAKLWPTPTAGDARGSGSRNIPTSKAHAGVSLTDAVTTGNSLGRSSLDAPAGRLNPTWVEWLMGWPLG